MKRFILLSLCSLLSTCAEYESHVAAREDSLSGYAKDGNYGGAITHRVEYR